MNPTPQILNDALCAYIHTFRRSDLLVAHLEENRLEDAAKEITTELDALVETATVYLWDFPGGVPWTDDFKHGYRAHLQQAHPWLDDQGAQTLFSFSGWLCWHEGLNAPVTQLS